MRRGINRIPAMIYNICAFTCKLMGTKYSLHLPATPPTLNFVHDGREVEFPLQPVSSHYAKTEKGSEWILFLRVQKEDRPDARDFGLSNFYKATFEVKGQLWKKAHKNEIDMIFSASEWPTLEELEEFSDEKKFDLARSSYEMDAALA